MILRLRFRLVDASANRSAMPSLEESFPTLVGLESDQADPVRELRTRAETFESLLRVAITRASENVRITTVLESLDRAGFLEPSALAAAQPIEIVDTLGESGTRLPPRDGTAPHAAREMVRLPVSGTRRAHRSRRCPDVHPPRRAVRAERGRPGDGRRHPASRPGQAHLPGRPGHLPHPGPPRLDRRHRRVRRGQSAPDPPRRRAPRRARPAIRWTGRGGPPVLQGRLAEMHELPASWRPARGRAASSRMGEPTVFRNPVLHHPIVLRGAGRWPITSSKDRSPPGCTR